MEDTADIPMYEEIASNSTGRNAADSNSKVVGKYSSGKSADNKHIEKRRSDRLKGRQSVRKISSSKLQQAHTPQSLGQEMGSSCSSQLDDLKMQNQQLKNLVTLHSFFI